MTDRMRKERVKHKRTWSFMFKLYFFIALRFQKKKKEEGANNAISSKFN